MTPCVCGLMSPIDPCSPLGKKPPNPMLIKLTEGSVYFDEVAVSDTLLYSVLLLGQQLLTRYT